MSFAQRIDHLKAEGAYAVLARAQALEAQGREIIHLEIGQPDFDTFPHVALEGVRAITAGKTRYNPPAGVPELRRAIAAEAGRRRGVEFAPQQVVIAPGTKPLILLPLLALLEPGDEVIYPDPGFPSYSAAIGLAGGQPVPVPLLEMRSYDLNLDAFDEALSDRTRLVILNSPSNPTGGIHTPETLEHVAQAARERDLWILSDEIYARLVYDGEAPSIVSLPGMAERTIVADGFSKTYAMTGWRLGYGIMPVPLADKMDLLLTHSVGCTATFTQLAGLEAILGPQDGVDAAVETFRRRRDLIVMGLQDIPGVRCPVPQGAFYVFPNVSSFGRSSAELADYLLEEAGVAVLPGTAFGQYGEGYLRFSYASSLEKIATALERVADALSRVAPQGGGRVDSIAS
ncbi:MAG TPA: pyridoxal phosphate-dependent aminotransferase [Anaerolineae bacterium]|nr:pyridoxal phosphate-dependent aminotransferase [Anaerolineae bacterium]